MVQFAYRLDLHEPSQFVGSGTTKLGKMEPQSSCGSSQESTCEGIEGEYSVMADGNAGCCRYF